MSWLGRIASRAATEFRDRPALVDPDGVRLSYVELDRQSDLVSAGLVSRGLPPGAVLALRLPSTAAYVVAYLAAAKAGLITTGVSPTLAPAEQQALVDLVQPAAVLVDPSEVAELAGAGARADSSLRALRDDPDRPVALVFTSGTTGLPKAALFCERQLVAARRIDTGDVWGGGGPMLASTQFAHVGFMTKLPWYLATGATQHLLTRWRAAAALRTISQERMVTIGGVAAQIALMLRAPESKALDFSAVRLIVVGAGPSPPAVIREARHRFGAAYSVRYSSTESGGCGTAATFDDDRVDGLDTVGQPRGGIEVVIRDGEVWLRSPTVMSGYWNDAAATSETLVDGWLRTGDMGELDEHGNLRLVGRRKEMYIRGGYNVFPAEVEAALLEHPGVAEVAIVPRADEVMGEVGVAVVVPVDGVAPPTIDDLRGVAASRLARYKLPDELIVVPELPLTPMQKVDRRLLAQQVADAGR